MINSDDVRSIVREMGANGAYDSDDALRAEFEASGIDHESVAEAAAKYAPYSPEAFVAGLLVGVKAANATR